MGWQAYADALTERGKSFGAATGAKGLIFAAMAASTLAAAGSMQAFDESLAARAEPSGAREVVESYAAARQPVGQYVLDEFVQSEREQAAFEGADLDLEGRKEAGRQRMLRRIMASEGYLETLRREREELSGRSWPVSQRSLVGERLREIEGREAEARELLKIAEQAETDDPEQTEAQLGAWLDRWEAEHGEPYRPGLPYAEDLIASLQPGDPDAPWSGSGGAETAFEWGSDEETAFEWGSDEETAFEWGSDEETSGVPQAGAVQVLGRDEVLGNDLVESGATRESPPTEGATPAPALPRLARVAASELDLRAGLTPQTPKVRVLLAGTQVVVRSEEADGWVSVEAPALQGFVRRRDLRVEGREGVVQSSRAKLHADPSSQSLTRALLVPGTRVRLGRETADGWVEATGPAVTAYVDGRSLSSD